jgi:hypothetical protein
LQEAEDAILRRAATLDDQADQAEPEVQALEEAADFIREMKLNTQTDGVNKQMKRGATVKLPHDGQG